MVTEPYERADRHRGCEKTILRQFHVSDTHASKMFLATESCVRLDGHGSFQKSFLALDAARVVARIHKLAGKAGKKEPTRNTISAKVNFA